jgi:glycosyltransferase involved in cell wall biosynthesis
MKKLSVICPVYNESEGISRFHEELNSVLKKIKIRHEIYYINDGSTDNTYKILKKIKSNNTKVKLINLSRNFGKESALTAGIKFAEGELILTIDSDGQHPPRLIPEFLDAITDKDMVVGIRSEYQKVGLQKKLFSKLYYWLSAKAGVKNLRKNGTDFRLFRRNVADTFLSMTERSRMVRGMFDWMGFDVTEIEFEAPERIAGSAQYSFKKLLRLALDGITSEGILLLYISLATSLFIIITSFGLLLLLVAEDLILGGPLGINPSGTAYLTLSALLLIGVVILFQGISSLFIARIHNETAARPLFIVKDVVR